MENEQETTDQKAADQRKAAKIEHNKRAARVCMISIQTMARKKKGPKPTFPKCCGCPKPITKATDIRSISLTGFCESCVDDDKS